MIPRTTVTCTICTKAKECLTFRTAKSRGNKRVVMVRTITSEMRKTIWIDLALQEDRGTLQGTKGAYIKTHDSA